MKAFAIYCHTHIASGRKYVGQTMQGVLRRWSDHVKDARRGSPLPFHRAIVKYGCDAFAHETLQSGISSVEEANRAERNWILSLGTLKPNGFNLDLGGGQGGTKHPDTRRKMSESAKVQANDPNERRVRSDRMKRWRASLAPDEEARLQALILSARTPEARSETARLREASRSPERRHASAMKREATMDHETRREGMRRAWSRRSAEERRQIVKKGAPKRAERQSASATARWASRTPEQRRAIADKAWATRRMRVGEARA